MCIRSRTWDWALRCTRDLESGTSLAASQGQPGCPSLAVSEREREGKGEGVAFLQGWTEARGG
ncbi:unnamed protein product, partial [Nesidiocoris tenuis]